jgi:hypothetical protein
MIRQGNTFLEGEKTLPQRHLAFLVGCDLISSDHGVFFGWGRGLTDLMQRLQCLTPRMILVTVDPCVGKACVCVRVRVCVCEGQNVFGCSDFPFC